MARFKIEIIGCFSTPRPIASARIGLIWKNVGGK